MQAKLTRIAKEPSKYGTQGIQIEGKEGWLNVVTEVNVNELDYMKVGKIIQLGEIEKNKIHLSEIRGASAKDDLLGMPAKASETTPPNPDKYFDSIARIRDMRGEGYSQDRWIDVIIAHINTYNFNK